MINSATKIHSAFAAPWIASRSLSSGARSRDPLARNDGEIAALSQRLQHLMHVDHDVVGVAGGGGDEQVFHQPAVFFGTGLELGHGAAIDQLWVDRLAALEFLQQFD